MEREKKIQLLEDNLSSHLKPVHPDPNFTKTLENRLLILNSTGLETNNKGLLWIIVSLGLFTGALIVWLIRRLSQ